MADATLTAMVSPDPIGFVRVTTDGTPYKTDTDGLVYAYARHVTEVTAWGYTQATGSQVPAGDPLVQDTGWAIAT